MKLQRVDNRLMSLILLFFIILTSTLIVSAAGDNGGGSSQALADGHSAFSDQLCVCKKLSGYNEVATRTSCTYTPTSGGQSLTKSCNMASANDVVNRYILAGVFGDKCRSDYVAASTICADAVLFTNNAEQYSGVVQAGLETKTGKQSDSLGIKPFNDAMDKFNDNAHFVYSFLLGFGFITSIIIFILIFMKILWLPDHPIKRREAMEDIVTSGVATIMLGGIWLFVSVFQSIFDRFWASYAVYSKDWRTVGNIFLYEYKGLIAGILGIATLTAVLMFVKNLMGLSMSGGNPNERRQKMTGILICGIATAGLGALSIFVGFFWGMLR